MACCKTFSLGTGQRKEEQYHKKKMWPVIEDCRFPGSSYGILFLGQKSGVPEHAILFKTFSIVLIIRKDRENRNRVYGLILLSEILFHNSLAFQNPY